MSDYSSSPVALENVYELHVPLCLKSSDEMTAATKTDLKVFSLVSFRLFRNSATISLGGGRGGRRRRKEEGGRGRREREEGGGREGGGQQIESVGLWTGAIATLFSCLGDHH